MNPDNVAILINTTFSLVELLIRLQRENPDMSKAQAEKIVSLQMKMNELAAKPADYLQSWKG